ncbi:phosphatidylserine decarboxylase [Gilliamella sp. B14448G11]|uniref:archaetidylserine decarboxylase n=1 Tax=unclassified Gilliamella TaxID=2685620 RepID=UPI0018DCF6B8|nr:MULTISPECIES: archaetidylserine decarboxylase [unclassified Gilliamella]MBI0029163.1 phosphatidylserine decarboxylase [Gilliamella sp. B14448G7]MBI0035981.1 phosphatidylserine decarboxylase [Gilliamella sp. B14448G11]MBI0043358.1 phosphatidylserine decarboxylase [Gilliamella sp. B14448G12]
MSNQLKAIIQYLLPKQLLTSLFGWLAKKQLGKVTTWIIQGFMKLYKIDLSEAELENAEDYKTFNDFFARKLKEDARPIDSAVNSIVMPADGTISQFGTIQDNLLLQAKGHYYSLESLLACHSDMIKFFKNGSYATTYLSPKNYHRFHMPCDGVLREMIYVPGSLFSVSQATTECIPNIFARNERVICLFETDFGPMAQILVGATIVGSIEVQWEGCITPPREGIMKRWVYSGEVKLVKGQDMGCFKLGSTVITLFASNTIEFDSHLKVGNTTRVGQKLAERI